MSKGIGIDILIDFDGTCVTHDFPNTGADIGAAPVLRELVANGHNLILFTMRGSGELSIKKFGNDGLAEAVKWFKDNDIPLYGIQTNPTQHKWTNSPKAYGHLIIDDTGLGTPVKTVNKQLFVDWKKVRPMLLDLGLIKRTPKEQAKKIRNDWYKAHTRCPICSNPTMSHTMVGVMQFEGKGFEDNINKAQCALCEWKGNVNQLIPE
jgi:hypothetical protein